MKLMKSEKYKCKERIYKNLYAFKEINFHIFFKYFVKQRGFSTKV